MRIGIETKSGKSSSVGCGTSILPGSGPGSASGSAPGSSLFLRLDLCDRAARLLPGTQAAFEMGDRHQAHVLRRLGRQRRAPGAGAEEDELVAALEYSLAYGLSGSIHISSMPRVTLIAPGMAPSRHSSRGSRMSMKVTPGWPTQLHRLPGRHGLDLAAGPARPSAARSSSS